jgi:hypothetical protein
MGNKPSTGLFSNLSVLLHHHLLTEELHFYQSSGARKRKRTPNRRRNRQFILDEINELSDVDFRKMFRMNRSSFEKLLATIEPLLYTPNVAMARRSSGSTISKQTKLYCTLRWLSGGSYLDICIAYGVSRASFFSTSYESV